MLTRRRSLSDFSPCNSTNGKYVKAVGCWATTESEENEFQLDDSNVETNYSEVLGKKLDSVASFKTWSMGSFLERCPTTPSPILSPVSSLACSPPAELFFFSRPSAESSTQLNPINNNQSSCIISNTSKKPASAEEDKKEEEIDNGMASHSLCTPMLQSYQLSARNTRKSFGSESKEVEGFKQDHHHKPKATPESKSIRTMQQCLWHELESASGESVIASCDDQASHCIVLPIINEDKKERGHKVGLDELINGLHAPLDQSIDGYAGSNRSGYGDSDVESLVSEHGRLPFARLHARPGNSLMSEIMRRNEMETKLIAWKEAKVLKLVNSLRKKEAEINDWEYKQASKAKRVLKEFEKKMEKKRERAYEKMEKKIRRAEKKAEEKKAKDTHSVSNKIANIYTAVDKIHSTGKLPWKLISLLLCC